MQGLDSTPYAYTGTTLITNNGTISVTDDTSLGAAITPVNISGGTITLTGESVLKPLPQHYFEQPGTIFVIRELPSLKEM